MDGEHQIMISEALNESDRLSSCNKRARKVMESQAGPFHVYVFQAAEQNEPNDEAENPEDSILSYNLGGIRMNEAAFRKLEQEISLVPLAVKLPPSIASSDKGEYQSFQRHRPGRPRHLPQNRGSPEPRAANQCRGFLGPGLDRPLLLRSLHRPRNLRRAGKEKSRQPIVASTSYLEIYLVPSALTIGLPLNGGNQVLQNRGCA